MSVEASSLQNQDTHVNNNHEYKTKQNEGTDEEDEYHLENSEQLSVLIEPELSPQIVRIDKVKAKKLELRESLKRQALKNPVLSTLDVLISIFVVTSLVVGCWRGTWVLMDRHSRFFPMWESFLTGISAHALLAFGQSVFHDIIIETKKNNNFFRIACFILKKFYTYAFMVATVLHWRGGWAILDYYTGIQIKDNKVSNAGTSLVVAGVCLALLFLMKCVINATAPPFAICMDKGEDMFLFPTMFRQKVLLLIAKLAEENSEYLPSNKTSHLRYVPRGFATNIIGPIPREFISQTTTERPRITTLSYPQLSYRSTVHHPRNIQDILGYLAKQKESTYYKTKPQSDASNIESSYKPPEHKIINDPFFKYKPSNPSDINLLATASFRFAPPIWKNFFKSKPEVQESVQQASTIQTILQEKPLSITLNIFPMDDEVTVPSRPQRKVIRGYSRENKERDAAKMTINLKVYPEVVGKEDVEQIYAESRQKKVVGVVFKEGTIRK